MASKPLKCVIVGNSLIGKSCLFHRYAKNDFLYGQVPTVIDHYQFSKNINGTSVEFLFIDTSGLNDYDRLRPVHYPDTDIFLLCFSVENPYSFESILDKWYPEVHHFRPKTPIILIGTKKDLLDDPDTIERLNRYEELPITFKEGEELAKKIGAVKYFECSALKQEGLDEIFHEVARCCKRIGNEKAEKTQDVSKSKSKCIIS